MISIEKAQDIILKSVKVLPPEEIKLHNTLGRVLAENIRAACYVPSLDNSAMDGFAVRSCDAAGSSRNNPKQLEVIEDLRAGYLAFSSLKQNQAIRIMTGAPIPKGADSVVMVEDTKKIKNLRLHKIVSADPPKRETRRRKKSKVKNKEIEEFVKIYKEIRPGENIRRRGEDIKKGELVFLKGTMLGPAHIGVLASLGISKVKVTKKPKVAVLATGDEVVGIKGKLLPGKIRNSNTYTLCGQILKSGGIPKDLGIAGDDIALLKKKIKDGLSSDLILTSGGVSVGDYDLVKSVLQEMGTDMKFWKVAIKPGKPLAFGVIKGIPVFGLPGNPVSGMIGFELFVRPVIAKMTGQGKADNTREVIATLEEDIRKKKGRRHFLRAVTRWDKDKYLTKTTGPQGSGILKSMILANSLIILPEDIDVVKKGEEVTVRFLS